MKTDPPETSSIPGIADSGGDNQGGDASTSAPIQRIAPANRQYGQAPTPTGQPLNLSGVNLVETSKLPIKSLSDKAVDATEDDDMFRIMSATFYTDIGGEHYFSLPKADSQGQNGKWMDNNDNSEYPSHRFYVRNSYEKAASIFLSFANSRKGLMAHMFLGGTSGIGKTYFSRYMIWRLLHPDGFEVTQTPKTILFRSSQSSWHLYRLGRIYLVQDISELLATPKGLNLFNRTNAWIICDGAPPPSFPRCNTLVVSSTAKTQDEHGTRRYKNSATIVAYLPTWSPHEIWTAARVIYGLDVTEEPELTTRFKKYGGIPRSIFQKIDSPEDVSKEWFAVSDAVLAVTQVGSEIIDQSKISGQILHLVPDETLLKCTYQWGSAEIMMKAFELMFKFTKTKIECFLHGGMTLSTGTFYGLLFEPYFHSRVKEQGYKGRMRLLEPVATGNDPKPVKPNRTAWGTKKSPSAVIDYDIPMLKYHVFHRLGEIVLDAYNVPDRKNFAAVDALAPSRGEMFQVTSAEKHPVKVNHLLKLKSKFNAYLHTGKKVKLIFIVPPNRFDDFVQQQYKDTSQKDQEVDEDTASDTGGQMSEKKSDKEKKDEKQLERGKKKRDAHCETTSDEIQEDMNVDWVEQYVMEMDVNPLTSTFNKRVEWEVKRSIAERLSVRT